MRLSTRKWMRSRLNWAYEVAPGAASTANLQHFAHVRPHEHPDIKR
jgi:hypothetical protein